MKRLRLIMIVFIALFTITILSTRNILASWYAGNDRSSTYGAQAKIYTPALEPDMVISNDSGQSSWISTSKPYWIQAGWRHWPSYPNYPKKYTESCRSPCVLPGGDDHQLLEHGTVAWGTNYTYKISHINGDTWCAYINDQALHCRSQLNQPPREAQVRTEVHGYPQNEIYTYFKDVKYRTQSGNWYNFNQEDWKEDFPYGTYKYENYRFHTYRRNTVEVYIPLVIKNP